MRDHLSSGVDFNYLHCLCLCFLSLLLVVILVSVSLSLLLCKVAMKELLLQYVNYSSLDPPPIQKNGLFEVTSELFHQSEVCFLSRS